jgi:hypothetical protein
MFNVDSAFPNETIPLVVGDKIRLHMIPYYKIEDHIHNFRVLDTIYLWLKTKNYEIVERYEDDLYFRDTIY